MARENAGADLEVAIGVQMKRLTSQLAQVEARMVNTAKRSENAFKAANTRIVGGFDKMNAASGRLASGGLRNASLQLSQVAQQGAVTGDYLRACVLS